MEINNAFDAPRGASGGASRAEPLYANAGIVIPEKGAVRGFIFPPPLVPELPGRAQRAWHFYPVPGWRVGAAGAADTVIYGVSNTIRALPGYPGITCSSQAGGLFLPGHGARFYLVCLGVLVAPLSRLPPLEVNLALRPPQEPLSRLIWRCDPPPGRCLCSWDSDFSPNRGAWGTFPVSSGGEMSPMAAESEQVGWVGC